MTNTNKKTLTTWYSLFFFFLISCFVTSIYAKDVLLQWNPNNEPDLAGYRVFYREEGQSYDYANPYWEGIDTTCNIYDLDDTKTYYFVARAFDTNGLESSDSNEVFLQIVIYVSTDGSCGGNQPCYTSIQDAIDAAPVVATINITEGTYVEDVVMDLSKKITLQGGWDSTFTNHQGVSRIKGEVILSKGKVVFDRVHIMSDDSP